MRTRRSSDPAPAPDDPFCCRRRFAYEEELKRNPLGYDTWFDYVKLEEEAGDIDRIREVRTPALPRPSLKRAGVRACCLRSCVELAVCATPHQS